MVSSKRISKRARVFHLCSVCEELLAALIGKRWEASYGDNGAVLSKQGGQG